MADPNIIYEANLFLYDLANRAKEHWFKAGEKWELVIVSAKEKATFEKNYFPVVSLEVSLSAAKAIAEQVNDQPDPFKEINYPVIKGNDPVWLLAYNPLRLRT